MSRNDIALINLQNMKEKGEDEFNQIQIHLSSEIAVINFYQLCKYSRLIQEEFQNKTSINELIDNIEQSIKKHHIKDENVNIFFDLLKEGNVNITSDNYFDLYKLSLIFRVNSLQKFLIKYAKNSSHDLDFIFNNMINQISNQNDESSPIINFSIDIEDFLSKNIEKCMINEKFGDLPISVIYRIIERSDKTQINSDILLDFILKSIDKRISLFHFLDIKLLSDEKLTFLCQKNSVNISNNLPTDFIYLSQMKQNEKKLKNKIKELKDEKKQIINQNLQKVSEIQKLKSIISNLQDKNARIETQFQKLLEKNKPNTSKSKNLKTSQKEFTKEYSGNMFSGIFNELTKIYNGNICEKGIVRITGNKNEICQAPISTIIDFNYNEKCYYSKEEKNSYICFDFLKQMVSVTAYSIMASNQNTPCFLRSWKVEGSQNQIDWMILDSHSNDMKFNSSSQVILFQIEDSNKRNQKFRFVRLQMTGENNQNNNCLDILRMELFGSYFDF